MKLALVLLIASQAGHVPCNSDGVYRIPTGPDSRLVTPYLQCLSHAKIEDGRTQGAAAVAQCQAMRSKILKQAPPGQTRHLAKLLAQIDRVWTTSTRCATDVE